MINKTWNKAVNSALTTIIGFSSLSIVPTVFAQNDHQSTSTHSAEKTIATNATTSDSEFIASKIYHHKLQDKEAVTIQFQSIPVITFLSDSEREIINLANQLATRLDELYQKQANADLITVNWDKKDQDYTIKFKEEELISINKTVILPDTTNNPEIDALQATNRLRRLLGGASPLTEVIGKPKPVVEESQPQNEVALVKVQSTNREGVRGMASWYGGKFHGRKTASGERFNQNALTAAHPSLPFGTKVQVTNLRNGDSVIVRINDRGPFSKDRIIDLSAGAARVIGVKSSGVAPVKIQVLDR